MIAPTKISISTSPRFGLSSETVVRAIWQGRKRVGLMTLGVAMLGVLVALLIQPEFVSEAKIMPEMGSRTGNVMKQLASVAGLGGLTLSEGEEMDAIRPDLYPNVLQSTPFILYLIDQPVVPSAGDQTTIGRFLLPNKSALWSLKQFVRIGNAAPTVRTAQKPGGPVRLSEQQKDLIEDIGERVRARLDTRSGVITITAQMPDASIAASSAQLAMAYLTHYVTAYRTDKARQDLHFYRQRLSEARHRYQSAQLAVFRYNDAHKHMVIQAATMDGQRREAELTIAQSVYSDLSQQFERAKLTVQQQTPIFKVLEPAQVPLERVSPKRTLLVLLFAVAGFAIGVVILLAGQANLMGRLRAMVEG